MISAWSSFCLVTANELADAIRSRRAIVLLVLYLFGSVGACAVFVRTLNRIEDALVETIGLTPTSEPGSVTRTLWKSEPFQRIMKRLVGSRELANELLDIPPLGLWYGWLAFTFGPLLIVLMSSPRIAEEVGSASVRFVLFRCSRAAWCAGKFAGQALLLLAALLAGAVGAWGVGFAKMAYFDPVSSAYWMFIFSIKAWVYGIPFLGLALGVSQWTRSPVIATGCSFVGMVGVATLAGVSRHWRGEGWRRVLDITYLITPGGHKRGLWYPDAVHLAPSVTMLIVLGIVYFMIGYARFARKDQ